METQSLSTMERGRWSSVARDPHAANSMLWEPLLIPLVGGAIVV